MPRVSPGKSAFGAQGAKRGVGRQQLLGEPQLRKLFPGYMGQEGSLQVPVLLPKPPAALPSQTHSLAYLSNGKVDRNQPNLRPGPWPLLPPSLAQPGKMAGWALSKGPRPARTRLLAPDPSCPLLCGRRWLRPSRAQVNECCLPRLGSG